MGRRGQAKSDCAHHQKTRTHQVVFGLIALDPRIRSSRSFSFGQGCLRHSSFSVHSALPRSTLLESRDIPVPQYNSGYEPWAVGRLTSIPFETHRDPSMRNRNCLKLPSALDQPAICTATALLTAELNSASAAISTHLVPNISLNIRGTSTDWLYQRRNARLCLRRLAEWRGIVQ